MTIKTIADITPGGAAVALSNDPNEKAVFIDMAASGSTVRTGDINVGAGRGVLLQAGVLCTPYPRQSNDQQPYPLSAVYVYATGGDKVSITYGV